MKTPRHPTYQQAKDMTLALAKAKLQKISPSAAGLSLIEQLRKRTTYMTVAEFAVLIGESPAGVYKRINEGRLPCVELGYGKRLDPAVMANFLEARTIPIGAKRKPSKSAPVARYAVGEASEAENRVSEQQTIAAE